MKKLSSKKSPSKLKKEDLVILVETLKKTILHLEIDNAKQKTLVGTLLDDNKVLLDKSEELRTKLKEKEKDLVNSGSLEKSRSLGNSGSLGNSDFNQIAAKLTQIQTAILNLVPKVDITHNKLDAATVKLDSTFDKVTRLDTNLIGEAGDSFVVASMEDWNTINKECLNAPVWIKRIVEMTCA